jgi:DHA2 family multidrug resistance protein-like MFS transporter
MGLAACAVWPANAQRLPMLLLIVVCGLGFGLFQVPNNQNMFMSAPRARSGAAGGMQGTARLTGQTTGALVMTGLFTGLSMDLAPRVGLAIAAVLALAAGFVSLLRIGMCRPAPRG